MSEQKYKINADGLFSILEALQAKGCEFKAEDYRTTDARDAWCQSHYFYKYLVVIMNGKPVLRASPLWINEWLVELDGIDTDAMLPLESRRPSYAEQYKDAKEIISLDLREMLGL